MALSKTFSDPTGASASYWIISHIDLDKLSEAAGLTLAGYQDQQTRLDYPREGIVQRKQVPVPTEDFLPLYDEVVNHGGDLYTLLYDYVKNNAEGKDGELLFDDAEDV